MKIGLQDKQTSMLHLAGRQGKQTLVMAKNSRTHKGGVSRPVENFILVSYSYFEKDKIQVANMEFFTTVGMGMANHFKTPRSTDFALVISGNACTPCKALQPYLRQESRSRVQGVSEIWSNKGIVMLHRSENEGMDFAAHNVHPPPHYVSWGVLMNETLS